MKRIVEVNALWLALAAAPGLVSAEADRGQRREGRFQRLVEQLGLSEEQQASWKALHEQHRAGMQPLQEEARELHQKLRAATDAENPDPQAVGVATLALKKHREKFKAAHEAFEGRLLALLTPEQKTKFEAYKAAHKREPGRHRGRGFRERGDGTREAPAPVEG